MSEYKITSLKDLLNIPVDLADREKLLWMQVKQVHTAVMGYMDRNET